MKGRRGFTLVEVLIAVAVLVVLLAVSIPAIISASRDLNITKLDAAAKEIYVASQNRLTALKASGALSEFAAQLNLSHADRNFNEFQANPPPDYPAGELSWLGLFYLTSDDAVYGDYVLSDMSLQAVEGKFIVELNPETGDVFSVFYCEYDSMKDLTDLYESANGLFFSRELEERKPLQVGYYSGSDLSVSTLPNSFKPKVTVHNGEELYLEITCPDMLPFASTLQELELQLVLTDGHGKEWSKTYSGPTELKIVGGQLQLYVLLDSLRAGASFAELYGTLTPGDDITAVVTMQYSYRGTEITTDPLYEENTSTFNSLFDSITEPGGAATINIAKLRHLNNLRSSKFNNTERTFAQVAQIAPIDFDAGNWPSQEWCPTTTNKSQPIPSFAPIVNDRLFGRSGQAGTASFAGNELYNMIISGGSGEAGLLAHSNCSISGFRIVDPIVNGGNDTGTLVGRVYGGSISDCGVYLTTANKSGVEYAADDMVARVARYRVNAAGSSNVGGLVGAVQNAAITSSFAALDVVGGGVENNGVGGFVGGSSGASITGCYSSGSVSANAYAGGFAGSIASRTVVTNCYTTSDVTAETRGGGFAGTAAGTGTRIVECVSYGVTRKGSGATDTANSGGFVSAGGGGATYTNCTYLRQNGYNSDYDSRPAITGVKAATYSALRVNPGNSVSNSFPYSAILRGTAFPFTMLTGSHYGDWPEEATIETSIIYYEKYTNRSGAVRYGYYADGFAKSGDGSAVSAWNLDTLMSQDDLDDDGYWLVEDGYAVLSIYNLALIQYSLNDGSQVPIEVGTSPGDGSFLLLDNPESLPLSAIDRQTGQVIGQFFVKYLYIFQLPFGLQETNRDANYTFYDKLVMTGFANGNLGTPVFGGHIFYYCPHFAKNAINPDVNQADPGRPQYPEEKTVYVRSARQLNALGRYSYYWNRTNAGSQGILQITFKQEINIDFGRYATRYCGRTFDLTNTQSTNAYRNRPIGRPMAQTFRDPWGREYRPGNFQNTYDGNSFRIVDYRLHCLASDNYQFAGMFGEIMNATIRNVVLVASSPGSPGSGYVINEYNGTQGSPGTGALVGLNYVETQSLYRQSLIENCAVSGYAVVYYVTGTMVQNNAAVGGLIGYNMGVVRNSSAVCYLVAAQVNNVNSKSLSVAGLIGGCTNGSVTCCYAGGNLEMTANSGLTSASSISGITRYNYVWAPYTNGTFTVTNSYSYCTIRQENTNYLVYGEGGPVNSGSSVSGCYYLTDAIGPDVTVTDTNVQVKSELTFVELTQQTITGFGRASASHSYPWSDELKGFAFPFPAIVVDDDDDLVHYGDWEMYSTQPAYLAYYEHYGSTNYGVYFLERNNNDLVPRSTISESGTIQKAGYCLLKLKNKSINYSLTFKNGNGDTLTIESAVSNVEIKDSRGVVYELFPLTSASIALLSPTEGGTLNPNQPLTECKVHVITSVTGEQQGEQTTTVYVNPRFARAIWTNEGELGRIEDRAFDIRTRAQLQKVADYGTRQNLWFRQTRAISLGNDALPTGATSYAGTLAALSTFNGGDFEISGARYPVFDKNSGTITRFKLTVAGGNFSKTSGNVALLASENAGTIKDSAVTLTGTLTLSGSTTKGALVTVLNTGTIEDVTIAGGTVSGASTAGFAYENNGMIKDSVMTSKLTLTGAVTSALAVSTNTGTISNVTVTGTVSGSTAAGFVYTNGGTISDCTISASSVTTTTGEAAGFVYSNTSVITSCAAIDTDVNAKTRGAGFVSSNAAGASIASSYVGPRAKESSYSSSRYTDVSIAGTSAFGFAGTSSGSINLCFVVADVVSSAGNAAGFGDSISGATKCFANCQVRPSGRNTTGAGFAITGTNISYSYACGEVLSSGSGSGRRYCGFMYSDSGDSQSSNCYTISKLPDTDTNRTIYGFGPTSLSVSNCYWVKDLQRDFNTTPSNSQSAGTAKTFYELSVCGFTSYADANPFTNGRGTVYPYSISDVTHMGDWPANPYLKGYIGIVRVRRTGSGSSGTTRTYCGYDCENQTRDTSHGPAVTLSNNGTAYYLYVSNDLFPALNAANGWTYETSAGVTVNQSGTTSGSYRIYTVTFTQNGAQVIFRLNGASIFTVVYSSSGNGSINFGS